MRPQNKNKKEETRQSAIRQTDRVKTGNWDPMTYILAPRSANVDMVRTAVRGKMERVRPQLTAAR
jgi:hypothetical protein